MKTQKKTGISKSKTDIIQPFRVFWNGNIIWFAKTLEEAENKLAKAKEVLRK